MANDKTINPASGQRLGHYQILRKLGAGGMGEVFLAEDTRLERKVAVKVLPAEVASNQERMRRFVLEAKAASSLNHPNIAHIYEIGDAGGTSFIAMEFIEGETLREKIRSRTIDLPTLLKYLAQVADGLAKAHAAGIVHRDLKPDNLMISRDGFAKILDFGLAKLVETKSSLNDGEPNEEAVTAMLPQPLSTPGMILGTVGYMSPEQAKGRKEIDQRSDVFSFGCVLFEAATGRAPFAGDSAVDVLHKIINQPAPPVRDFNPEAPPDLQRIVRRCLEKDPEERFQSIKDVSLELKELRREMRGEAEIHYSTAPPPPTSSPASDETATKFLTANQSTNQTEARTGEANPIHTTSSAEYIVGEIKRHKTGAAAAFVALLLILGGAGYGVYKMLEGRSAALPFEKFKITRLTNTGKASDAVISPDGRYVVHVVDENGQQSLWVRQVATTSNVQIVAPAETLYLGLTFSRDGDYVYYVTREGNSPQGNLYQIPVLGGTPRKLIDDVDTPVGFSPDQKRLAFIRNVPGEGVSHLIAANADGGEQILATLKRPDHFPILQARSPAWSPDGKTIACVILRTDASGTFQNVAVVDASSGALKELTSQRWFSVGRAAWLADGAGLLIIAGETPGTNQIYYVSYPDGELRRVTNDLNNYFGISLKADGSAFATVQRVTTPNIWSAPAADAAAGKQITSGGSKLDGFWGMSFAPDGRIVYFSTAGGGGDLWSMKSDGSEQRQLTSNAGGNIYPAVSSDGRYIAFVSSRTGTFHLWRMDADGGSLKQLSSQIFIDSPDFSPDGRWVIYSSINPRGLSKVSVDGGESAPVSQGLLEFPRVSPDGKFIACIYRESPAARYQLAILPFEGGQIIKTFDVPRTFERTRGLRWSPDNRAVYYIDSRGGVSNIWSQSVEGGQPKQLTNFKSDLIFAFDLSRDGKQLVLSRGTLTSDVVLIGDSR